VKVSAISGGDLDYSNVVSNVWTLMRDCWKVPEPKLIISVTGGAKGFEMNNPRIRNSFKRGLVKAATSAGIAATFSETTYCNRLFLQYCNNC